MNRFPAAVLLKSVLFTALASHALELQGQSSRSASNSAIRPGITVKVVRPNRGDILRFVTLPGSVRAFQQATLFAKVPGYLKRMAVDRGDAVKEGDLLAEIEAPELIADFAKFKAELDVAKIDFDRVAEAQKKAPDLVMAQTVDNARGKYEIARASLERIEILLGFTKITAPFAGVVTMRYVDPGAFIPSATSGSAANTAAILTLMDFSRVRVQVAVPESEVPLVTKGQPVKIAVEELPARAFEGEITRFSYALDEITKTMLAEAELPNPKWELRPGMFAQIQIGLERHTNAWLLPVEAIVTEKSGHAVFILTEGKAKRLPVKIGFNDGSSAEVLAGLAPEQTVILAGKQGLSDGQPVLIAEGP